MARPDPSGNHPEGCGPGVIRRFGIAARLHQRMSGCFSKRQPTDGGILSWRHLKRIQ